MVVDCTGDGDVCAWAGAPYECGESETDLQPGTLRYYLDAAFRRRSLRSSRPRWSALLQEGRLLPEDFAGHSSSNVLEARGDNINHISDFNAADSKDRGRRDSRAAGARCVCWRCSGVPAWA